MTSNVHASKLLDSKTIENINSWLYGNYDEETKAAIRLLLQTNPKEALDAFYSHLSFGTGGLRGIVGVGCNRVNPYTIRAATQGLANYLLQLTTHADSHSVFIGYDSRLHSQSFAEEAAKVLAANGITVYLCRNLRPTPLVSFGCRFKHCSAGIMITASHNPPEYNGYKIFWNDGSQIIFPHDQGIINEVSQITEPGMVKIAENLSHPLIHLIEEEIDQAYIEAISLKQLYPEQNREKGDQLKIVYTSLHGTGITLLPETLKQWGFTQVHYVKQQIIPDGRFPTVSSPNPEEAEALVMGIETLKEVNGDLLIATDPDADRVGAALLHQGKVCVLNGNEIACICLEHICEALTKQNKMPSNGAFVKTIATTELFQAIVNNYHKHCTNVLTGFKYIAEKIREWESNQSFQYIFGGEESHGYLFGTQTRDKDAIISSALICEAALHAKLQGKTLVDKLHDIWRKYGIYQEKLISLKFDDSKEGKELMEKGMSLLRSNPPKTFHGIDVIILEDYAASIRLDLKTGKQSPLHLPKSNVLLFWLQDQSKVIVRPSGTEPKIKLYCGVVKKDYKSIEDGVKFCQKHAEDLLVSLKKILH